MAVTINASTSAGLVQTADTSGVLQLQTASTTAVTVDASQNVGVGTTNPDVFAGGQDRIFSVVATGATSAINISGASASRLQLGVGSTRYGLIYQDASNFMQIGTTTALPISFVTNNTERARIDSSGNLGIGTTSPTNKLDVKGVLGVQRSTVAETSTLTMEAGEFDIKAAPYGYSIRFFNGTGGSSSEKARIDTSGNLLVGTTSTTVNPGVVVYGGISNAQIQIGHGNGVSSGEGYIGFQYNGSAIGSITQSGTTAVAYNTSSDYRLKNTIAPMTGVLAKVALLKPCTYKWNADGSDGEGFIAHELAEVCPSAVTGEKDALDADGNIKPQGIDTSFLVATLTAAIQEQQALITQLQADVAALKGV